MATGFIDSDELENCEPIIPEDEVVIFPYDFEFEEEDLDDE